MTDSPTDTSEARINSYRNAVRWSVDGFFEKFFKEIDLDRTLMIYTSDHGQAFDPQGLTHCSVEDPDPREAVVPLFVATDDAVLSQGFAEAAARGGPGQSHFSIIPTILQLFGYDLRDLGRPLATSLLQGGTPTNFFTTGDVFGLFTDPKRHVADPSAPLLEQTHPAVTVSTSSGAG
jgi:membrane-anchored protein YejM (alkaline phosphatase superfamily)